MSNPLCILAAGRGSRLGAFTNAVNKALLPVADKAVITHIIEKVSIDTPIVVALGYQGDKVRQYCQTAHPDRKFHFVDVPNYDGAGSGPGKSMWECRQWLQEPFYFCTVDCIVADPFPDLTESWLGVANTADPQSFCTVREVDNHVTEIINKKPEGTNLAFIGLAGVKSYAYFWSQLEARMNGGKEAELVAAFSEPQGYESGLRACKFQWLDTGTIENYAKTRRYFEGDQCFDFNKVGEFTYLVGDRVVKYFDDPARVQQRAERARDLGEAVPEILEATRNFLTYRYVPGTTLYRDVDNIDDSGVSLYDWCYDRLWSKPVSAKDFHLSCFKFYHDKTMARFLEYKKKKGIEKDQPCIIKGLCCQGIEAYLSQIRWADLCIGVSVRFHGDLQFDNIIRTTDDRYVMLDWRDSFADQERAGDLYYDLAKLNGGLMLPYNIIKSGAFIFYKNHETSVTFDWDVHYKLRECYDAFQKWMRDHSYDVDKVDLLTTLIYLNMSPLHVAPFDELLFNLAKMRLAQRFTK